MKYLFPVPALALLSIASVASVACTGILEGQSHGDQSNGSPSTNSPGTTGNAGTASTNPTPSAMHTAVPFKVRNTEPELVPFEMRLRRIASALGVSVDNPMFADMNRNSLKLGDYDYANGALPDGSWNANRIAAWINALKPVCASREMKAQYPALPEELPTLIRAAWGHVPSAEDTADFQNAIAAVSSDPAVTYESTCMAVFTAAEFVYR